MESAQQENGQKRRRGGDPPVSRGHWERRAPGRAHPHRGPRSGLQRTWWGLRRSRWVRRGLGGGLRPRSTIPAVQAPDPTALRDTAPTLRSPRTGGGGEGTGQRGRSCRRAPPAVQVSADWELQVVTGGADPWAGDLAAASGVVPLVSPCAWERGESRGQRPHGVSSSH